MKNNDPRPKLWRTLLLFGIIIVLLVGLSELAKIKKSRQQYTPRNEVNVEEQTELKEIPLPDWVKAVALTAVLVPLTKHVWRHRHDHSDYIRR